jgi:S-adenosyl methyltransferase
VLAHARALLTSTPQGACAYLDADLRDPAPILKEAAKTLDFSKPVAVLFIGVLHLVSDDEDPYGIVARTVAATVPGSYLAVTQPAADVDPDVVAEGARQYNQNVKTAQARRTREQTVRFFDGLELVAPGLVQFHRWRPDPGGPAVEGNVSGWAGVARKP